MINSELKQCCNDCVNIEIDTITRKLYAEDKPYASNVVIKGKHQCVCAKYKDDTNEL